jgi:hypothetical protein
MKRPLHPASTSVSADTLAFPEIQRNHRRRSAFLRRRLRAVAAAVRRRTRVSIPQYREELRSAVRKTLDGMNTQELAGPRERVRESDRHDAITVKGNRIPELAADLAEALRQEAEKIREISAIPLPTQRPAPQRSGFSPPTPGRSPLSSLFGPETSTGRNPKSQNNKPGPRLARNAARQYRAE